MTQRFTIYRHTNKVNGKRYVGQTVDTVIGRWKEHVSAAKHNRGARILSNAIRKYGADAFTHELLDVVTTQEGADIAEARWIEQSRSRVPNGYNLSSGGGGNGHHHEESKRLISESSRMRWLTMTPEQQAEKLRALRIWTPERRVRARALMQSNGMRIKIASGQRAFWSKFTPEEKTARVKHQQAGMTAKQKSDRVRRVWAAATPEAREARVRKTAAASAAAKATPEHHKKMSDWQTARQATLTHEQKRETALKARVTCVERYGRIGATHALTTEQRAEATRKGWADMTPEARAERLQNTLEGRRVAKANLTPEQLAERHARKSQGVKEGLRRAREARGPIRQPNLVRINLLPPVRNGGRLPNPNLTPEALDRARVMRIDGVSFREIAAKLRVPMTTMCRALKSGKVCQSSRPKLLLFNLLAPRLQVA